MMGQEFSDKVVLITGAGKGAGRALALAFAERGARVALNDISPVNVDEVVQQITASGGQARVYLHDVAKKLDVQVLVKQVEDDWGRIDVLINHAAVEPHVPLLDLDEWDWHRVLDVNLTGAFLMLQSTGRVMRASGGGVIVNLVPGTGPKVGKERGAYRASMGGLVSLTRAAAEELGRAGVRVHAVGTSPDVVQVVLSLCDSSAAHLNGQIMNVTEG